VFSRIAQFLHLIEAAATDDTDRRKVFIHAPRLNPKWIRLKADNVPVAHVATLCIVFVRPCRNSSSRLMVAR
jgi:hypothetical protein